MAADASVPNNFTSGLPSVADDVDANFTAVINWINTNAVHLDASKAFTSVPSGPATDPSSDNQLARKAYVDKAGAQGRVASVTRTTQQGGFTSTADVPSMSLTWTAVANRRYRLHAECHLYSDVINDIAQLIISDNSNNTIQVAQVLCFSSTFGSKAVCEVDITPSAGSVTYKLRVVRSNGTGNVTFDAGAVYPAIFRADDIGPA
jgi:hypothetical protein